MAWRAPGTTFRSLLFGLLAVRMFPQILLAIPFFVMARTLNLIDSYWMMILAMVAMNQPFTVWLMRSFFVDVPVELDEAGADRRGQPLAGVPA